MSEIAEKPMRRYGVRGQSLSVTASSICPACKDAAVRFVDGKATCEKCGVVRHLDVVSPQGAAS